MILQKKRIIMETCSNNLCIISFNIYKPSYNYLLYLKNDYAAAINVHSHTLSKLSTINSVINNYSVL